MSSAINRLWDLKVATTIPIIIKLRTELDDAAQAIQEDKFRERMLKTGEPEKPASFSVMI